MSRCQRSPLGALGKAYPEAPRASGHPTLLWCTLCSTYLGGAMRGSASHEQSELPSSVYNSHHA